jgi:chromate transporter
MAARSAEMLRADRAVAGTEAGAVFRAFLRLGLTSFGGPIAHLGYFRAEFVGRRAWIDEHGYADLVALCQCLPGPASSQVGFALGLMRAGWRGGLCAWAGFTLPSAVLLAAFASGAPALSSTPAGAGLLHGLKLVAVAVVAQAVSGMARSLCPDRARATIAAAAAVSTLLVPGASVQVAALAVGARARLRLAAGTGAPTAPAGFSAPFGRRTGSLCLGLFAVLLAAVPALAGSGAAGALFAAFYRSGALVFGGGHVVLPLLRDAVLVPGWISDSGFMAGYGAAQAVPGPLFAVAAYLGTAMAPPFGGPAAGLLALLAIFLPGLLLVAGALPFWSELRARARMRAALAGTNAAVVGLLGAALYDPVWVGAVAGPGDVAAALAGFVLLVSWRLPPLAVVGLGAALGVARGVLA